MIPVRRFRPTPAAPIRAADLVCVEPHPGFEPIDAMALSLHRLDRRPGQYQDEMRDLPEVPQTRGEMPDGAPSMLGVLTWRTGFRGRPFVFLVIRCRRCGTPHAHPWRGDWPASAEVVSYQTALCWRGTRLPYWVGLDPLRLPRSVETLERAREAFVAWKAEGEQRRQARQAKALETAALLASGLRPLWLPPVWPPVEPVAKEGGKPR
jgi:hypothetical protein